MSITVIDISLIIICTISFVSSENHQSSPSSILSALTQHGKSDDQRHHGQNQLSPTTSLNTLPKQQLTNIAKRLFKRFQIDLSTIDHGTNYLPPSSQRKHQSIGMNNKPSVVSSFSSSPKLLSIDLSVLDKPLSIPMIYHGDFEDLSFPRDGRSNEIEDNYYLDNHNNYNSVNSNTFTGQESADDNGYYVDNNDDMPNEIPLDPVYLDEGGDDLMVNDQFNQHHLSNFDQFPDHLSTGNDALSDYLNELKLSTLNQFRNSHQLDNHFRPLKLRKFGYPNTIIDLIPSKSNNYFNHYSGLTPMHQPFANWLRVDQPDSLNNYLTSGTNEVHQNEGFNYYQQSSRPEAFPSSQELVLDRPILTNRLHHHQHQLPKSFASSFPVTGNTKNEKPIQSQLSSASSNHQSANRVVDSVNNMEAIQ